MNREDLENEAAQDTTKDGGESAEPKIDQFNNPKIIEASRKVEKGWEEIASVFDQTGAHHVDAEHEDFGTGDLSYTPDKAARTTLHLPLTGKPKNKE